MRLRNTFVQGKKQKSSNIANQAVVMHFKLQGFQDLSTSIDLSFEKPLSIVSKDSSDLEFENKEEKRYHHQTQCSKQDQFPVIFAIEDKLRLDYYKYTLKDDFLGLIDSQQAREDRQVEDQSRRLTEDWIVKLKAKHAKKLLYREEALNFKTQIEAINRIRARLKIVDQIKQQKRRIIHHYFNS